MSDGAGVHLAKPGQGRRDIMSASISSSPMREFVRTRKRKCVCIFSLGVRPFRAAERPFFDRLQAVPEAAFAGQDFETEARPCESSTRTRMAWGGQAMLAPRKNAVPALLASACISRRTLSKSSRNCIRYFIAASSSEEMDHTLREGFAHERRSPESVPLADFSRPSGRRSLSPTSKHSGFAKRRDRGHSSHAEIARQNLFPGGEAVRRGGAVVVDEG